MIKGHRIERKIEVKDFLDIISGFKEEDILTTEHTFFRLSQKQRKIFKDKIIKDYLCGANPVFVGVQYNGNYAVFYDYDKNNAARVMIDIQAGKVYVVTFYLVGKEKIPRM